MTEQIKCVNNCCMLTRKKKYTKTNYHFYFKERLKAGVVVFDKTTKKVLMIQSRGNLWGFPKGSFEMHETPSECAIRELREETGLIITDTSVFTKAINASRNSIYFYVEMKEVELSLPRCSRDNDSTGIGWINLSCLQNLIETGVIKVNKQCKISLLKLFGIKL